MRPQLGKVKSIQKVASHSENPNNYITGIDKFLLDYKPKIPVQPNDILKDYYLYNDMQQTYELLGLDFKTPITDNIKKYSDYRMIVKGCIDLIRDSYNLTRRNGKSHDDLHLMDRDSNLQYKVDNDVLFNHFIHIFAKDGQPLPIIVKVFGIKLTIGPGKKMTAVHTYKDPNGNTETSIYKDRNKSSYTKEHHPKYEAYKYIANQHVNYITGCISTLLSMSLTCECRKKESEFINNTIKFTRESLNMIIAKKMESRLYTVPELSNECIDMFCNPFHGRCFNDTDDLPNSESSREYPSKIITDVIGETDLEKIDFIILGIFDNNTDKNGVMPQAYIDVEELIIDYKRLMLRQNFTKFPSYTDSMTVYANSESAQGDINDLNQLRNHISNLNPIKENGQTIKYVFSNGNTVPQSIHNYFTRVKDYLGRGITQDQFTTIEYSINIFLKNKERISDLYNIIQYQIKLNEITPLGALRYLDSVAKYNYGYTVQTTRYDDINLMCSRSYQYDSEQLHGNLPMWKQF